MYPTCCEEYEFVVVQWNASGLIRYVLRGGWGNHVLSRVIGRIYSTTKRGFLLVQYYVPTLDKSWYDVRLDSGMKRED